MHVLRFQRKPYIQIQIMFFFVHNISNFLKVLRKKKWSHKKYTAIVFKDNHTSRIDRTWSPYKCSNKNNVWFSKGFTYTLGILLELSILSRNNICCRLLFFLFPIVPNVYNFINIRPLIPKVTVCPGLTKTVPIFIIDSGFLSPIVPKAITYPRLTETISKFSGNDICP